MYLSSKIITKIKQNRNSVELKCNGNTFFWTRNICNVEACVGISFVAGCVYFTLPNATSLFECTLTDKRVSLFSCLAWNFVIKICSRFCTFCFWYGYKTFCPYVISMFWVQFYVETSKLSMGVYETNVQRLVGYVWFLFIRLKFVLHKPENSQVLWIEVLHRCFPSSILPYQ